MEWMKTMRRWVWTLAVSVGLLVGGWARPLPVAASGEITLWQWQPIQPTNEPPPARRDAALAYDAPRHRLILFGGRGSDTFNDTWAFDLTARTWQELATGDAPRPPSRFSMVWGLDAGRNRLLITTGQAGAGGFLNDVWAFDLLTDTWTQIDVPGSKPAVRYGSAGGIYPGGDLLYVSHGFTGGGRFDDTWAFDLTTDTWANVTPTGGLPLKRCLHTAALAGPMRLVLFGGCASGFGPCPLDDTWVYDGAAKTWTQVGTGAPHPAARQFPALAALGETSQMVLFGGQGNGVRNDTWLLDANAGTWSELTPAGNLPEGRYGHNLVWVGDASSGYFVLFGGRGSGPLNDLWMLTPTTAHLNPVAFLPLVRR